MAINRKYASLPGIDNAPDTYETPDLTDDASTIPPSTTARSPSPASSVDDADTSGISRHRLHPDQARKHFLSTRVDARDVDFSDSISGKRRSYRASARRRYRKQNAGGDEEYGDSSDSEDESVEQRLARLQREMLEVKADVEKTQAERQNGGEAAGDEENAHIVDGIEELSRVLEGVQMARHGSADGAAARLEKMLDTPRPTSASATPGARSHQQVASTPDSSAPAPPTPADLPLARAAAIDARLTLLEKALGTPTTPPGTLSSPFPQKPLLPTLSALQTQLALLSCPPTLTTLAALHDKLQSILSATHALTEARKAACASHEALLKSSTRSFPPGGGAGAEIPGFEGRALEDPEQIAKVNALYGTIGTVEALAPLLPAVLSRLHSLRVVHEGAARAREDLDEVERRQLEMCEEIRRWREGLAEMEGRVEKGEEVMRVNMRVVEGWVRDLEGRVKNLNR